MAADVLPLILDVWKRANAKLVALPNRISDDSLICKVERKWQILTNIAGKRGKVSEKQRSSFADELDKLFNILVCICEFVNCSATKCTEEDRTAVHINCNCARDSKSPQNGTCLYMKDQREKVGKRRHSAQWKRRVK